MQAIKWSSGREQWTLKICCQNSNIQSIMDRFHKNYSSTSSTRTKNQQIHKIKLIFKSMTMQREEVTTWNQELTINKNLYREMSTLLQFHLHFMHSHFLFIYFLFFISGRPPKRVSCFIFIFFWSCNLLPCNLFYLHDVFSPMKWGTMMKMIKKKHSRICSMRCKLHDNFTNT